MKSYRFSNSLSAMSDWSHAMFSDNSDSVEGYGRYCYTVADTDLVNFDEIRHLISETAASDYEDGTIDNYFFNAPSLDSEEELEAFVNSFNPSDIVMSAEAWDNDEFTHWFWDRVAEPNDIKGVKTQDGAVSFFDDIIARDTETEEYYGKED